MRAEGGRHPRPTSLGSQTARHAMAPRYLAAQRVPQAALTSRSNVLIVSARPEVEGCRIVEPGERAISKELAEVSAGKPPPGRRRLRQWFVRQPHAASRVARWRSLARGVP